MSFLSAIRRELETILKLREIRKLARKQWSGEEVIVPIRADVSASFSNGAYVQAWVWVSFDGVEGLDKDN